MSATRVPAGTPARDALAGAATAIAAAGCPTPRLDAEVMLAHVLGVSRERLITDHELSVAGGAVRVYQAAVRRRSIEREPVAYIVGQRGFRHLALRCDPRALIPRPETELLVEVALALPSAARVLDVGTGGGAVALALKDERPDLEVFASDSSSAALELARENGAELGLAVELLQADLLAGAPPRLDAILANLPYVAERERGRLEPEIIRHEPHAALFAGPDGLDAIAALCDQLAERPDVGFAALEVGAGQAPAVSELLRHAGFAIVGARSDLAGIERVVTARR